MNYEDRLLRVPLHYAAEHGHTEFLHVLLGNDVVLGNDEEVVRPAPASDDMGYKKRRLY